MKEQLVALINSYGAACSTGDPLLQQLVTEQLQLLMSRIEVTEIAEDVEAVEDSRVPIAFGGNLS